MRLTRDRALRRSVARIADFWTWWAADGRAAALGVIEGAPPDGFVRAVSRRVDAIDPRLSWHLEPGVEREHRLVVSAAGHLAGAATAERWRRQAPEDPVWEVATRLRGAASSGVLRYAGWQLALEDARFTMRPRGTRLDVEVRHPGFGAAVPERTRDELAMLVLDQVIGDQTVEQHVAAIGGARSGDDDGMTAAELRERVRELEEASEWRILRVRRRDGSISIVSAAPQLHPLSHLPFDLHTEVRIRFRDEDGAVARAQDEEERFTAALGGLAVHVLSETQGGLRTAHFYSDGADDNAVDLFDRTAAGRDGVRVVHRLDPEWRAVAPYR